MRAATDTQEIARVFNEDEALWRRFEDKRKLRDPNPPLPEELLDQIDWHEAEQERPLRCVAKTLHEAAQAD